MTSHISRLQPRLHAHLRVGPQVPCYMVVALDQTLYKALEALAPGHIVLVAEPQLEGPGYATPGTKQMRQVGLVHTSTHACACRSLACCTCRPARLTCHRWVPALCAAWESNNLTTGL